MAAVCADSRLTDEQHAAVAARVSVALSSGAGCGKTSVLTERFLRYLDGERGEPAARLSQVVAITFTDRAAREMRQRIRVACHERLLAAAPGEADYWLGIVRRLDSARIETIHSFCGSLLRTHAVEAVVDPRFAVLDAAQAGTLLARVIDEQLRELLTAQNTATLDLVARFELRTLREMVTSLIDQRHQLDFAQWQACSPAELVARWQEAHRQLAPVLLKRLAESEQAVRLLRVLMENTPSHATMRERRDVLLEQLPALPYSTDAARDLAKILDNAYVRGGGGKKAWKSEETYEDVKSTAEALRKEIENIQPLVRLDPAAARQSAALGLEVLNLAAAITAAYDARKQQLGLLDFDDLLLRARDLLLGERRAGLRERISSQIELLLVDEFQDTDPLQASIMRALADPCAPGGRLFVVGDRKQSIYRFRRADPQVFQTLRGAIPRAGRMSLTENFRSQPAILDFVNALCHADMGDDYEPLRARRPQVTATPAVEFVWACAEEEKEKVASLRRREADWIARRLRAMFDRAEPLVWDQQAAEAGRHAARAVQPGDVAILFRALSDVAEYEEALRRYQIDYYLVGGHAFYAQQEIFDLLNLLRALASTSDTLSLAGVLRSPFFSLSDEAIFWLASVDGGLAAGLERGELPASVDGDQHARVGFAAATLAELRGQKDRLPVAELLNLALDRTGYDAALVSEFLGERKLANLRKLIDQARRFDRSGIFALADFIAQLSEFVADQPREPLASTQPEVTNVVTLMTIHQAKGLEFPVVVVPDVDRQSNQSATAIAFHRKMGPMVRVADDTDRECVVSGYELHRAAEEIEEEAESIRLLYVATTRAADYLILSAGLKMLDSRQGTWMKLLQRRFDLARGTLRVTLPAGYRAPLIRVTTERPTFAAGARAATARVDWSSIADQAEADSRAGRFRIPEFWQPVPLDLGARRAFSFSRISGAISPMPAVVEEGLAAEPAIRIGTADPLGLGTLVHAVLAEIDFSRPEMLEQVVTRLGEHHLPGAADQWEEAREMLARFLAEPCAARITASRCLHREAEFLLAWPPDGPVVLGMHDSARHAAGEGRYIEGFIDCLYQDAGGRWHLIDYKTNHVTEATLDAVVAVYEPQLWLYATAAQLVLGEWPASVSLNFLRPGVERAIEWDAPARATMVERINRGIAELTSAL